MNAEEGDDAHQISDAESEVSDGDEWQEEFFQKVKSMKEMYLPSLNESYHRTVTRLQQLDARPPQQRPDYIEKLKEFKKTIEKMMQFVSISKSNIVPQLKDNVAFYEKQLEAIHKFAQTEVGSTSRATSAIQMQPMQQAQSQTVQDQSHDNQTNPQIQP